MLSDIDQNLLNLLESGEEANVALAIQLQKGIKSEAFEAR